MLFVFDVDDTLYDMAEPFRKSIEIHFSDLSADIETLFKRFRHYSDLKFESSVAGTVSMEDMHCYRISEALKEVDYSITKEQAIAFQNTYQEYQYKITLIPEMESILNLFREKSISIGIITNGPAKHQRTKVDVLNLAKWVKPDHIIISGEVGVIKPSPEIFYLIEGTYQGTFAKKYYIGDSFHPDVVGALAADFIPIWINKRNRTFEEFDLTTTYEVKSYIELKTLIEELILA